MKATPTDLDGVILLEPMVFKDARGFFLETFHRDKYAAVGIDCAFVQDNLSYSQKNTLRGLHFQLTHPQAKLVQVISGEVFDVAVDIRHGSPTFGRWHGAWLSGANRRQLFIPAGFAHGFCVVSESAYFHYKCSDVYTPGDEGGVRFDDPDIGIDWPADAPLLSDKDRAYRVLKEIPADRLPRYRP